MPTRLRPDNGQVIEPDAPESLVRWLVSPAAEPALVAATAALADHPSDPLAAAVWLRRTTPDLPPDLAAAALAQAELRRQARDRYGVTGDLLLTRDGLEAATRPEVADRRAGLVAQAGARRVLDLTGGLGFDTAAFLRAGVAVTAIERDPAIALLLAHNCPSADVIHGDGLVVLPDLLATLSPDDVVFVDPARRDPGAARDARSARARPERDPERWSPPWSSVAAIPHPRIVAKVAPGFAPPNGWTAEWVSVDRTVVECSVASWPLAPGAHRAVALDAEGVHEVVARDGAVAPIGGIGAWLHEPDPAVLRAGALDTLALDLGLQRVDPRSSWLTGASPAAHPLLRSYQVVTELAGSPRRQRRALAELGIGRLTVKCKDSDIDPSTALRTLAVPEGPDAVLVVSRVAERTAWVITRPAARPAR